MRDEASACVCLLAPLRVDCLGDLPEHDPDHRDGLAGDKVLLVQWGTLGVPLSQQLVRSTSPSEARPGSSTALPISLLQPLEHGPQMRVQVATGSDLTPATGVWLALGGLR